MIAYMLKRLVLYICICTLCMSFVMCAECCLYVKYRFCTPEVGLIGVVMSCFITVCHRNHMLNSSPLPLLLYLFLQAFFTSSTCFSSSLIFTFQLTLFTLLFFASHLNTLISVAWNTESFCLVATCVSLPYSGQCNGIVHFKL